MDGKNSKMSINFYKKRVLKEKKIMVQFWCVLIVLWTYICPQHVTCADRFVAPIYIYIYSESQHKHPLGRLTQQTSLKHDEVAKTHECEY